MFIIDIETLDIESTAIILSIACTHLDDKVDSYQDMLDNSIMLKFDVREQLRAGRTSGKSTRDWWERQSDMVKKASLIPNENDLSVQETFNLLKSWLIDKGFSKSDQVFARGALDSVTIESLARTFDIQPFIRYNQWLDVRTAIDFMYETSNNGYVDVDYPGFEVSMVLKHHPVHDCAYDGMMLLHGKK